MVQQSHPIDFEDIPIEDTRQMGCGPRMHPVCYHTLKAKLQSLSATAVRMYLPEGTRLTTMKHRIVRVAAELKMRVTIRRVPDASSSGAPPLRISGRRRPGRGGYTPLDGIVRASGQAGTGVHRWQGTCDYIGRCVSRAPPVPLSRRRASMAVMEAQGSWASPIDRRVGSARQAKNL